MGGEAAVATVAEALASVGLSGPPPPLRPILRARSTTLVLLATLDAEERATWHGLSIGAAGGRTAGPANPRALLTERLHLASPTAELVDLLEASSLSCLVRLEELGQRFDELGGQTEPPPLVDIASLQRRVVRVREHIVRLNIVRAALAGPFGASFPGVEQPLATLGAEVDHLDVLAGGLAQGLRDLVALRNAVEANRLAQAANELGRTSNKIAALANTSNLRMLGVAYLALLLALVSAVVLFPNTGATILGMPSAAWVPGVWVDLILVALAIVPLALVLTRPWVRRMLTGLGSYELRSSEGLSDLPEVSPGGREAPAESLIRRSR